jgi:hypothetical protein
MVIRAALFRDWLALHFDKYCQGGRSQVGRRKRRYFWSKEEVKALLKGMLLIAGSIWPGQPRMTSLYMATKALGKTQLSLRTAIDISNKSDALSKHTTRAMVFKH